MRLVAVLRKVEGDVLPLDHAPEPFDEGVVGGAAPAVAADAAAGGQQGLLVGQIGKLAALSELKRYAAGARCRASARAMLAKAHVERIG